VKNQLLSGVGLVLGAANTVRHRMQGYVNPRPFSAEDADRAIVHAFGVVNALEDHGVSWHGRRVLEVGPGPDMATGAIMLDRGAASYHAVDLFDNRNQAPPDLYRTLESQLSSAVDETRLGFTQTSFPGLPELDGEFDLIVSNACLEHVADIGGLFARLRQLSAPRTTMVHQIDGMAHMRWFSDHDPLNHLRYSERVYRRILDFPGAPNRLRSSQFAQLARSAGWSQVEIVADKRAAPAYLQDLRVAPQYQRMPDLDLLAFTLTAAANGDAAVSGDPTSIS
jgi:hypothetical protein